MTNSPQPKSRICRNDAEIIAAAQADGEKYDRDVPPNLPARLAAIITAGRRSAEACPPGLRRGV